MRRKALILAVLVAVVLVCSMPAMIDTPTLDHINRQETHSTLSEQEVGSVVFTEHGSKTFLGDNRWRYRSSIGEENTWNGTHYLRYVYDLDNKQVSIGRLTFTHGPNGVISVSHSESGSMIGELKWYAQYYLSDQWNNFTFDNYEYLGATKTDENATISQRWWSTNGELNVSYTYYYWNELKMRAEATNWAAQTVPVRVLWAMTDIGLTGVDYSLIYDDGVAVGVEIGNAQSIYWHDVTESTPEININPVLDKENRRAAVVFGNMSSTLAQYETMDIDPTYTVAADIDDDTWDYAVPTHLTSLTYCDYSNDTSPSVTERRGQIRVSLSIAKDAVITDANVTIYDSFDQATTSHKISRIDETNVGSLEGDASLPSLDSSPTAQFDTNGVGNEWTKASITDLIQEQVNLAGWVSGYYIGLAFDTPIGAAVGAFGYEDYQAAGSNHVYVDVEYYEIENFVDQISDLHDPSDMGTHSDFAEMQDKDGSYDTLTEEDIVEIPSEWKYVDGLSAAEIVWTTVGASPYLDGQDQPTNYIHTSSNGDISSWYTLDDTSGYSSGSNSFTVNASVYWKASSGDSYLEWEVDWTSDDTADASGSFTTKLVWGWNNTGTLSGLDTVSEINQARIRFIQNKGGGGPEQVNVDAARIGIAETGTNYELDLEVGWVSADYDEANEELCIFGGTQGSEALRVDVWSGSWTNVFTDIAVGWNNISVTSYLTDATFEIRFTDTTNESVEADTWQVEAVLLHTWTSVGNNIPINDQTPTLDNADDTDNMYAQYREYKITVYVSDQDGYADIDYLEIGLWDDSQTTEYFRFRYDEDTDTFTEEYDSGTVVSLNAGSSIATETGNDIDAQFWFTIDWDHADLTDIDTKCYVVDDEPESDTDWYEANFDVETRLDYSVAPAVTSDDAGTVDRGDYDETFLIGGTLIYYTSVDDYPPSAQVDVWVSASEYGTNVGPWSDLTLTSGAFEVTCYADDALGQDTYTIKPVIEAAGAGGATLYYTTDLTDTYIADIVQVQSYSIIGGDDRIDTGATVTIDVTLWYDYDDSLVTDGTVTVNGLSAAHQGSGVWRFTDSEATVLENTYDTVAASGNTHGITVVNQNSQTETCIWDEVIVVSYSVSDPRVNVNDNVNIDVTIDYDFDDTDVTDGTVTINGASAVHQGSGVWRITDSEASVMQNTYDTVAASGNTHGITVVNQNSQSDIATWDRVQVQSYTTSDDHDNINDDVTIDVTLWYDYDDTLVIDGTVTINAIGAAHQGSGVWRITENKATVQEITYDTVAASGNTHGITLVDQNSQSDSVIWDQIVVQTTVSDDAQDRLDINANVEIRVTLWLDFVDEYLGSGDTVTLDDVSMTWDSSNSWFDLTRSQASVNNWLYYVNSSSEATYGITALDVNSQEQEVIWDRIIILTTTTQDGRINYDTQADIRVTAQLEYDSHALGTGDTLYMNDTSMSWVSTYFQLQPQFAQVGLWNFFVNSSSANEATYGITVVNLDSKNVDQIWDRLVIDMQADLETPDNGQQVNFTLTVTFEYGGTCNTYQIAVNRSTVWWHSFTNANKTLFNDTNSDVSYDYSTYEVTSESTYGITVFTSNTETVTWSPVGNNAPVNDTQPTAADLDDTDNLYAYIRFYTIIAYVSDQQGFADIDYMEVSCYSNDQGTLYWTVRYDEDTDTFSETFDPSNYIYLDTGASSAVETGNDIDATFKVRINWNHPDISETDFKCYVIDDEPESDTDWYENNWDYETRLDYSVGPGVTADDSGTVDRGDLDETFLFTGTIIYYGGTVNPTTAIVDVWVSGSEYGSSPGPWSDTTLTSGAFSVSCSADDAVGQDTYTVKVVTEGAGSGGTDLYYTTSATDTYIADQITVQTTVADDSHVNINDNVEIRVTIWLAYNAEWLGSGDTVTLDDVSMTWDAVNSWFDLSRTKASIGLWTYFVNSSSEATHGITGLNLNSQEQDVIWNSLTVSLTNPSDQHIDINANASGMVPSAVYDYGGGAYDGTFTMNNSQYSYATAQKQGYNVSSANGDDTHGITTISSNTDETNCIWNSLTAIISAPNDQNINVGANASGMLISATYDYNSDPYDGTLSLNDEDYAHSVVGNYSYYVNAGDGDDTHGITVVSSYNETWCIFDRLIWTIVPDDSTPDNGVQVNFTLTVIFDFDDSACTTYKLTITRDTVHWYTFTEANKSLFVDTASNLDYEYDVGSIVSESQYDITAEYGLSVTVTWSAAGAEDRGGVGVADRPVYLDLSGLLGIGLAGVVLVLIVLLCMNRKEVYYE